MKNTGKITLSAVLIGSLLLQTGCFGSYKLTQKVYAFHNSIGPMWVKEIILIVVGAPVYGFCAFADTIVFNTLEYWAGSNPIAMNDGQSETKIIASKGKKYEVTATKNKFTVTEIKGPDAGKSFELIYSPENKTWTLSGSGESHVVSKLLADGTTEFYKPNGDVRRISADEMASAAQPVLFQ